MTASDDARKALEGVTPGPWQAESGHEQQNGQLYWQVTDGRDAIVQNQYCWCQGDHAANARFIAWCREGVPALLADLAAKDAAIARLRGLIDLIAAEASKGVLLGSAQDQAVLDMMKSLSAAIRTQPHDRATHDRLIAEAVADERERCAKIADDEFGGRCIADKIRGKWVP